ncbi:MAG: hypothetical protein JKY24_09020 [Pseudomonadales bacterium]|nr:hypothetical protein [Pseudomonadales bacterium]
MSPYSPENISTLSNISNIEETETETLARITLVTATDNPLSQGKLGWEEIRNITYLEVEATHHTIIKHNFVSELLLKL